MIHYEHHDENWESLEHDDEYVENYCLAKVWPRYDNKEQLVILCVEPHIEAIYVKIRHANQLDSTYMRRFVFKEGLRWSFREEQFFKKHCLENPACKYVVEDMNEIYKYYSKAYPTWNLKRYYNKSFRLLEHIYHCMKQGSVQEILFKSGLDELASKVDLIDEYDLLASKPTTIYGGVSMRALRALNCEEGAKLLADVRNREFIKTLQGKFPTIFDEGFNDAQCLYLKFLIEGELTVGEAGRLFQARREALTSVWNNSQFELFMSREKKREDEKSKAEIISEFDKIYKDYLKCRDAYGETVEVRTQTLRYYLLDKREEYEQKIRRSNRKRNSEWQERNNGYVVRYPQTINDFCREAIYMCNCLLTYVEAFVCNDTTILFMRKSDDFNAPFITIEIYKNELMQAYHRYNVDCTSEEAEWIKEYCQRHEIGCNKFKFNNNIDELF